MANRGTQTYDAKNISISVGAHIVGGFADGTFLKIERNNDSWTTQSGASGETVRSKTNDRTGKYTFTLQQTSLSNDVLMGFFLTDELKNLGKFPIIVREVTGNTVSQATEAWVMKLPSVEYGKESGNREWVIETGELLLFVGGII